MCMSIFRVESIDIPDIMTKVNAEMTTLTPAISNRAYFNLIFSSIPQDGPMNLRHQMTQPYLVASVEYVASVVPVESAALH